MTKAEIFAAIRHLITFVSGIIITLGTMNVISVEDATNLNNAVTTFSASASSMATAISTVVAIISTWYATKSATPDNQIKQVQKLAEQGNEKAKEVLK